jgi:hypothetical protein
MSVSNSVNDRLIYRQCSVHFDRINICVRTESTVKKKVYNSVPLPNDFILFNQSAYIAPVVELKVKRAVKFTIDDKMSNQTISKIKKAIKYVNFISSPKKYTSPDATLNIKYKLVFLTLTLASLQIHSDQLLKSLLVNQLIIELKKRYHICHYVWRCEKQSNGNVHFHFIVDQFVPHAEIREIWNRIQNKLGYVDRYAVKMRDLSFNAYKELFTYSKKSTLESIRASWKKGKATDWQFPNSTDIHSLQFINSIDDYLIKYMSKDEQNKGIGGRLWGCSHSLSNLTGGRDILDSTIEEELNRLVESKRVKVVDGDYYSIIFYDFKLFEELGCYKLWSMLREWLIIHFNIKPDEYL